MAFAKNLSIIYISFLEYILFLHSFLLSIAYKNIKFSMSH